MQAATVMGLRHQASLSTRRGYLLSSANVFRRQLLRVLREVEGCTERASVSLPDSPICIMSLVLVGRRFTIIGFCVGYDMGGWLLRTGSFQCFGI